MYSYSSIPQISVAELAQYLIEENDLRQLIDVRELSEVEIAKIPQFTVLPLSQFSQWGNSITTQFNLEAETIVLCHHGIRSAQMCAWLLQQGFENVKNVTGGIDAYSRFIDSTISRY